MFTEATLSKYGIRPDTESYATLLTFARETAREAGRLTLEHYRRRIAVETKPDGSPVTVADRETEALVRERIEAAYPDHGIVGEELGVKDVEGSPYRWFVDPIDGTRSFVHGVPLYAVLLGLEVRGHVRVGAAYFPALDEMLYAATGLGCWWNGQRARVSAKTSLSTATLCFGDPDAFARHRRDRVWSRLQRAVAVRAGWSDAYGYLLVATGRADIMIDPVMCAWDCGPFPAILEEAGGYFGDWHGNPTIHAGEAMATSLPLLGQTLATLAGS